MLTAKRLRQVNVFRSEHEFNHKITDWSVAEWLCAMLGEVGEALSCIKKMNRIALLPNGKRGEELDIHCEQLGSELADTLIYLDLLCARLGFHRLPIDSRIDSFRTGSGRPDFDLHVITNAAIQMHRWSCKLSHFDDGIYDDETEIYAEDVSNFCNIIKYVARSAHIDLEKCIIQTFNHKSAQMGFKSRLMDWTIPKK